MEPEEFGFFLAGGQQPCTDDLSGGILPEVPEGAAGTGSGGFHLQYLSGDSGEEDQKILSESV